MLAAASSFYKVSQLKYRTLELDAQYAGQMKLHGTGISPRVARVTPRVAGVTPRVAGVTPRVPLRMQ